MKTEQEILYKLKYTEELLRIKNSLGYNTRNNYECRKLTRDIIILRWVLSR